MAITTLLQRSAFVLGIILLLGASRHAQAQEADPGTGGGPTPTSPTPTSVPIDGGASLLLAGSVAYGLRRLRQRRQQ